MPANEPARQAAVDALNLPSGTLPELDQIAAAAAEVMSVGAALVTIVDRDRTRVPGCFNAAFRDVSRGESVCAHGILNPNGVLCVPDLSADPRFADFASVAGADGLRFYAGAPVLSRGGEALGMLCALDTVEHDMPDPAQVRALQRLARVAAAKLEG